MLGKFSRHESNANSATRFREMCENQSRRNRDPFVSIRSVLLKPFLLKILASRTLSGDYTSVEQIRTTQNKFSLSVIFKYLFRINSCVMCYIFFRLCLKSIKKTCHVYLLNIFRSCVFIGITKICYVSFAKLLDLCCMRTI